MKRILFAVPIIGAIFLLSGCSLSGAISKTKSTMANATLIKTQDGGNSWNPKMKIDEKKNIAGIDVLNIATHPTDPNILYLATASNGLFVTKDAGESWAHVAYADKAYGLVFDPRDPNVMYGSGIFNGRAKLYKRINENEEWREIYTEPADGTTISALAIDRSNPQVLYAGTSKGMIIKTTDGGQTWINLKIATPLNAPISNISFDSSDSAHVFFLAFQAGLLETRNAGASIEEITRQIDPVKNTSSVFTIAMDPYLGGVIYVGTGAGIFKRDGSGKWNSLNIIESSKAFPVRAIAINPRNSREIIYSAAKAIYKSTDGGATWSTFQLDTSKDVSVLRFDQANPNNIYAGMRSF